MDDADENPRPAKRQKTGPQHIEQPLKPQHIERPWKPQPIEQPQKPQNTTLSDLLLSLPYLLLHPPTNTNHERSLALSHYALKKCTTMTSLDRVVECRAATGLAELGLQIGLSPPSMQDEIQKAITKASLLAQNHPSLQLYRHRLTHLSAQLSLASGNAKAAQNSLKRSLMTTTPNDAPHILYTIHLAHIASISSQSSDETTNTMRSLGAINDLREAASKRGHKPVIQLALILRLRALMRSGSWSEVGESLDAAEDVLGMEETLNDYTDDKLATDDKTRTDDKPKTDEKPKANDKPSSEIRDQLPVPVPHPTSCTVSSRPTFEYALIIHTLILGVIFHTYTGDTNLVNPRLKWMYELLDTYLPRFPKTGIFEIPFSNAPSLHYQLTHPRVIYVLGFLVSSLAKRDLVGRKPKKRVFASEGIIAVDKELKKELACPIWASISDVKETDHRLKKVRADLMCELIGASIMRSEFDEAERLIDETISYTRTQSLFSSYAARITLHEAQLAHALNKPQRALQCYQIAAWLSRKRENATRSSGFPQPQSSARTPSRVGGDDGSPSKKSVRPNRNLEFVAAAAVDDSDDGGGEDDPWLNVAARAGELWLRIGLLRQKASPTSEEEDVQEKEIQVLRKAGEGVIQECRGLGGTLEAIAEVLESCLTKEFVKAKTHLRRALNLTTSSQDNHLRALILSLIASHYLHTSNQHAEKMLETAENLSAGLGIQSKTSAAAKAQNRNQNRDQGQGQGGLNSGRPPAVGVEDAAAAVVGNVHLRLWIGERFLELYNRTENKDAASQQAIKNKRFRDAVAQT